jgi:transcriptional regulator EpsA
MGNDVMSTAMKADVARKLMANADPDSSRQAKSRAPYLDGECLESMLLNFDASLEVYTRAQLFNWTQGLLQSLIPHRALVCALRTGRPASFRVDGFSTLLPDAGVLGDLLLRDSPVLPGLIDSRKQRAFRPEVCAPDAFGDSAGGPFARELDRIGVRELLVHGCHDIDAEVTSLFLFGCAEGCVGPREIYLIQLVVLFLHAALVRSQTDANDRVRDEYREAPVGAGVLSAREREVLYWVYLGKSNGEIGSILKISPLTAKNHIQKILRKLDVVNRAQAVGKALNARIIRP